MIYQIAEKFKSIQGEGGWTGTPMAFIRFVGCSVGKKVCQHCDTDFDKTYSWRGGGEFSAEELAEWTLPYPHVCLTGGEPYDQLLEPLFGALRRFQTVHVETSGTKPIIETARPIWIACSPKPGYIPQVVMRANEIKVIVGGLGVGEGWPTLEQALEWAKLQHVYLQPRNKKDAVDMEALALAEQLVQQHSQLRLSVQLHKLLKVR